MVELVDTQDLKSCDRKIVRVRFPLLVQSLPNFGRLFLCVIFYPQSCTQPIKQFNMEWFSEWFNSPYYHILYQNRDYKEAESFIENLIHKQHFVRTQHFLDLACGKGRHAIYLNSKGFKVLGLDIAPESIT